MIRQVFLVGITLFMCGNLCFAQINRCATLPFDTLQLEEQENRISRWIASRPVLPRTIVTIPIVVHVVYYIGNPTENISDEQIQSQIVILNQDFRGLSPQIKEISEQFQLLAADVEIEFCLASVDPKGKPTNGITRTETTERNIANNAFAIKDGRNNGIDAWDTNTYLNIWVGARNDGVLGQATRPEEGNIKEQGLVIDHRVFGTVGTALNNIPYNQGRTIVHEIGHYFGLKHLWGDDNEPSCSQDDGISDTPRQRVTYANQCPSRFDLETFTCGTNDMYMNFMNYTDDACMAMFSLEQKKRMLAVLYEYRQGLLGSNGCTLVATEDIKHTDLDVSIYPNPAINTINIAASTFTEPINIILCNALGRKMIVLSQVKPANIQLSVEQLPRGYYFLFIQTGRSWITKNVLLI